MKRNKINRKHPPIKARWHECFQTLEVKIQTYRERILRKLFGAELFTLSALSAVSLASYDWWAVESNLPSVTNCNFLGVVGNAFAHGCYLLFGYAAWYIPLALLIGAFKLFALGPAEVEEIPNRRIALRIVGFFLIALVVTGFFQLAGKWDWVRNLMAGAHIGNNAGGQIGYRFMTCGLEKCMGIFGAIFIGLGLLTVGVPMAFGFQTVRGWWHHVSKLCKQQIPRDGTVKDGTDDLKDADIPRNPQPMLAGINRKSVPKTERKTSCVPNQVVQKIEFPVNGCLSGLDLLDPLPERRGKTGEAAETGTRLMETLKVFGVDAALASTIEGPVVTQYAILPAPGVRVERITGLTRDLQRVLKAKTIRIFAPIPGEDTVGVQIPNRTREAVTFREIVESGEWQKNASWPKGGSPKIPVPLLLGKNVAGEEVVEDLTKMPHLLVAGASGKGKSVCLSAIINGLLVCRTPEQLRLILVDPKGGTEFKVYEKLPHLLVPVVTDVKQVVVALRWAVNEMSRRQKVIAEAGTSDIQEYNATVKSERMPYIVVVIDELADIMILAGREVEPVLSRLMALARATGIHLILTTQRPDVKVISGTIKANIPGRVAFATTTAADSRTILDESGAETLIGNGDMLYRTSDGMTVRAQGAFVSRGEKNRIVEFTVKQWPSLMDENLKEQLEQARDEEEGKTFGEEDVSEEEYEWARSEVISANRASTSYLQRRMRIGYNHAAKIIDLLEARGIVGPSRGASPREVLVTE